jgi:hypothetical protein
MNNYMSFTKNAAAFGKLVGICAGYEGKYNPARQNLSMPALKLLAEKANHANLLVDSASQSKVAATGQRSEAFLEMNNIAKRLRGEIYNLTTDECTRQSLKNAIRRMSGQKPVSQHNEPSGEQVPEQLKTKRSYSTDYETRLAAFVYILSVLAATPEYKPSVEALSLDTLGKKLEVLKVHNAQVNQANAVLNEARNNRRKVFYQSNGVIHTTRSLKNAFKAIFGNPSDELGAIRSVRFY